MLYTEEYWSHENGHSTLEEQIYNVDAFKVNGCTKNEKVLQYTKCGDTVLEIACAPGILLKRLTSYFDQVIGVECDDGYAKDIASIAGDRVTLRFGLFPDMDVPGGLDCVIALDVFEHVPDGHKFLSVCKSLLRPGGQLIMMLPLVMDEQFDDKMFHPVEHAWIYSKTELNQMLLDHGFTNMVFDRWTLGHELVSCKTSCSIIANWMSNLRCRWILFNRIYLLQNRHENSPDEKPLQKWRMTSLGAGWYTVCWTIYKVCRPFQNLKNSLTKRFFRRSEVSCQISLKPNSKHHPQEVQNQTLTLISQALEKAKQKKQVAFKHAGNAGDIIYCLPALKVLAEGRPSILYLQLDQPATYSEGSHPLGNVTLNAAMANALLPLLRAQPYLQVVEIYHGQPIDYDLDLFRNLLIDFGRGHIARWYYLAFGITADLSNPWLHIPLSESQGNTIVLARSNRYRNENLDFHFLNEIGKIRFVGLKAEYEDMRRILPRLEYVACADFLQLARVIRSARFFIGNQSFPYSVAEAMKVPRILEVCPRCPNVIPDGENGYEAYFQPAFERVVEQLMRLTDSQSNKATRCRQKL